MRKLILAGILIYLCAGITSLSAEGKVSSPGDAAGAWREALSNLRKNAEAARSEYEQLNSENEFLRKEIVDLENAIETTTQGNIGLTQESEGIKKSIEEENRRAAVRQKEIQEVTNKITALEEKNESLKNELSAAGQKQQPQQAARDEFNTRKASLESKLAEAKSSLASQQEALDAQMQQLKNAIAENEKKTQAMRRITAGDAENFSSISKEIFRLDQENQQWQAELVKLKKAVAAEIEKEKTTQSSSGDTELAKSIEKALAEKDELTHANAQLEAQLTAMRQTKEAAGVPGEPVPSEKENLLILVNSRQAENDELKDKIADLEKTIKELKKEKTMTEALLETQDQAMTQESDPHEASLAEAAAYAFGVRGRYEEAIKKYEEALAKGGSKKDIYFNLGSIYFKMGNIAEAAKNYQQVLKIDPRDSEAKRNLKLLRR